MLPVGLVMLLPAAAATGSGQMRMCWQQWPVATCLLLLYQGMRREGSGIKGWGGILRQGGAGMAC